MGISTLRLVASGAAMTPEFGLLLADVALRIALAVKVSRLDNSPSCSMSFKSVQKVIEAAVRYAPCRRSNATAQIENGGSSEM
jgi:hypothetical protein